MGGKNSERNPKDKIVLLDELRNEVGLLNSNVEALHKKVDVLSNRWNYWLKKEKRRDD